MAGQTVDFPVLGDAGLESRHISINILYSVQTKSDCIVVVLDKI